MRRSHPPTSLADLLPKVIKELKEDPRPSREMIQEAWARVAGKEAALHSWPRALLKGRLVVEVDSSGWMYTLNMKRMPLLQGLIEQFGAGRINQLTFRVGEKRDAD